MFAADLIVKEFTISSANKTGNGFRCLTKKMSIFSLRRLLDKQHRVEAIMSEIADPAQKEELEEIITPPEKEQLAKIKRMTDQ